MNSLYGILLFGSALVPFILSFDKKLQFYKQWKYLFPSIFIIALIYIVFDVLIAKQGIWGFNPDYLSGIIYLGLPLEEYLFFLIIPYASIFLHDSVALYFSSLKLGNRITKYISIALVIFSLAIVLNNIDKAYTVYIFIKVIVFVLLSLFNKSGSLNVYYITFLIILIPFIIVNGILTGSFINEPVVWYNNDENIGIRFFTIPIEDFFYAFSLMGFVILLRKMLMNLFIKRI